MTESRGWRRPLLIVVVLCAAAWLVLQAPRRYAGSNMSRETFGTLYADPVLPPTATDVSFFARDAWGTREIVVGFTVPDEPTFVAWVTPLLGEPEVRDQGTVSAPDGGGLRTVRLGKCLAAVTVNRNTEIITHALYDFSTRRVYYQKAHRSRFDAPTHNQ